MFQIHSVLKNFKTLERLRKKTFELNLNHKALFFGQTRTIVSQGAPLNLFNITTGTCSSKRYFSEEKKMQPPIGVSDFREIIEYRDLKGSPYLFIDKSLFIKALLEDSAKVKLITRPRRFGKTLNMSMLHHFFADQVDNKLTAELFKNLKIAKHSECMQYQGKYPVISLTFKDIKNRSFEAAYADFFEIVRVAYLEHEKMLLSSSSLLKSRDKQDYETFLDRKASDSAKRSALKNLTFYLSQHYGIKPIVLIDEYDTPIQTAYVENYYKEMVTFMREFLGAGLKDNSHLDKAILTGILRVSKESLFSGLNNIETYSLLDSRYGEYFGFTEEEVLELLKTSQLDNHVQEVREWYNGYQCGSAVVYNPWSIINYVKKQGTLSSYWVNTSDNILIKDLLIRSSTNFKAQFEFLLQDKPVEMLINEHVVFSNLETSESAVWSLLLMSGYLKATPIKSVGESTLCQLQIPNKEVKDLYRTFISEWLSGVNSPTVFNQFLSNLLNGKMEDFEERLGSLMLQTFSVHDIKGKNPEKFFHGFMLGLIAGIDHKHYKVDSNKESGLGRYDIIIVPNDPKKLGIIIEIKSLDKDSSQSLKEAAENALKQIDEQKYSQNTLFQNIKQCLKVGIAFRGKELATHFRQDTLHAGLSFGIKPQD